LPVEIQKKLIKPPDSRALKGWGKGVVGKPGKVGKAHSKK